MSGTVPALGVARYPKARQVPAKYTNGKQRLGVTVTGGPKKVVHHKTVTKSDNASALYATTGSWPHFTVSDAGVQQHFDTAVGSRAMKNVAGGVQTNSDSAIQIEIVGMPGVTMSAKTCEHLVDLLRWTRDVEKVPWVWPEGRPPVDAKTGAGLKNGERDSKTWDAEGGHYGHSQAPENDHWDPAYTDLEWFVIQTEMAKPIRWKAA